MYSILPSCVKIISHDTMGKRVIPKPMLATLTLPQLLSKATASLPTVHCGQGVYLPSQ